MESNAFDPSEAQRAAERAEAAPYVDYPPTPRWYYPAGGAWAAAYVALLGLRREHDLVMVLGLLALVAVQALFMAWYRRYHGAVPNLRHAPREFRRAYAGFAAGLAVVIAVIAAAWLGAGHVAGIGAAFVTVAAGLVCYERAYAAAARRTRERLA